MQDSNDISNNISDELYNYDSQNYKKFLQSYAEDLRTSYNRSLRDIIKDLDFTNIIVVGSSWSLNAVKILQDYLQEKIKITFQEGYDETLNLSNKDLVIAVSYSGNSEEAITWLKYARRANAKTIIITAGEKLKENSFNTPVIDLSKNLPSRCSTFTIIGTLLRLFEDVGLINNQLEEVQNVVNFLRSNDVSVLTQDLSSKIYGVVPLIYATQSLWNTGIKFKRLININAKTTSFFNKIPGLDYYELEGFVNKNALFHAIILSTTEDLSRVKKKTAVIKEMLQNQGVPITELNIKHKGLTKIITALMIAEYTSYYLALRYKQDPLKDEITKKTKTNMGLFI